MNNPIASASTQTTSAKPESTCVLLRNRELLLPIALAISAYLTYLAGCETIPTTLFFLCLFALSFLPFYYILRDMRRSKDKGLELAALRDEIDNALKGEGSRQ